jgi:hypothetical protein
MTDRLGPIPSRWQAAQGMKADIEKWLPEYLAAYERGTDDEDLVDEDGHATQATAPWKTLTVRHAAALHAAEDHLPAIVVWIAGVTDHQIDPAEGWMTGTLQLGVAITAGGRDLRSMGDVVHRYAAAVTNLLLDHTTCGGHSTALQLVDEDFTRVSVSADNARASADLSYEAKGVLLGKRGGLPTGTEPRQDPRPPWATPGVFDTATFGVGHIEDPDPVPPFDPVDPDA